MRKIRLESSQGVEIEYTLSSVIIRFGAAFIDMVLFYFYIMGMFSIISWDIPPFIIIVICLVSYFLYYILMEQYAGGQTLGKKAVGIRVIRLDGRPLTIVDSALRVFLLFFEGFISTGTLAILFAGTSKRRQRLGDLASDTVVVNIPGANKFKLGKLQQLSEMSKQEVVYDQVTVFSEDDMLFMKQAIQDYNKYKDEVRAQVIRDLVHKAQQKMDIHTTEKNKINFLKQLIRDYVILTR